MAFSLRKMLSNINYFTKPGDDDNPTRSYETTAEASPQECVSSADNIDFDCVEADSTSKRRSPTIQFCKKALKQYEKEWEEYEQTWSTKHMGSLSDTDILSNNNQEKKKSRKLKLDIEKASTTNNSNYSGSSVNENTPKHKLLDSKTDDYFKGFNFDLSFDMSDIGDVGVIDSSHEELDIESLSDQSDTDLSDEKADIRMCRKVEHQSMPELLPSTSPESFGDVEIQKNEEKADLLLNYQTQFDKLESFLKTLLTEFQFHVQVSKVFDSKSLVPAVKQSKNVGERGVSPWGIVTAKEENPKLKLKNQLTTMRKSIDEFIDTCLQEKPDHQLNLTYMRKRANISHKKKIKHFDFPDLRDALINLFGTEDTNNDTDTCKCSCQCHVPEIDSPKSDKTTDQSISSSIGNFTLDSTTLSAYSESLDQIISYNSFETDSLYNTLLQKSAIDRISFYIRVHSIELKCDTDIDCKNVMSFYCPTCKTTEHEENSLLNHILSPDHCEKIHFVYKRVYLKKCITSGKEIQPSTVLNPMTMYRDENKIVCFGDALYACSLCFENLIVGESMLMAHCADEEHVHRREMMVELSE